MLWDTHGAGHRAVGVAVKEIQRPSTFLDSTNPTDHSAQNKQEIYQQSTNSRRALLGDITNQCIQQHVEPLHKKLKKYEAANEEQKMLIQRLTSEKEELAQLLESLRRERDGLRNDLTLEKEHAFKAIETSRVSRMNEKAAIEKREQAFKTVELLKAENLQEKSHLENTIAKLSSSASSSLSAYHTMKQRYLAVSKVKYRLQQKFARDNYCPWLNKTQQMLLFSKSTRGVKWDPALIRTGLILKMKCGIKGYSAFVKQFPLLPSARSLQQTVQFIKFDSGLLDEIFDLLESILKEFPDVLRDCILVADEMAIAEGVRYCQSLKKFVGDSTFPTHSGRATKALLFVLAGVCKRWKVTVAVYFTNKKTDKVEKNNETGEAFKSIINQIIMKAESAGAKDKNLTTSFENPASPGSVVRILPDFIHLFKSIKAMLENNMIVNLPQDIVEKENLPSAIVSNQHIEDLMEFEENFELKVAFRLKPWNVNCKKHFSKMKVGTSRAVICHRTSVGLDLLAEEKSDPSHKTTAWFVELLNTFFELVSSRHKSMAFSHRNKVVYDKAVALVNKGSSYDYEESDGIENMLEVARAKALERANTKVFESLEELMDNVIPMVTEAELESISAWEKKVIYDMAGSVICNLKTSNITLCDACISASKHKGEEPHLYSTVTSMKEYTQLRSDNGEKRLLQIYVSQEVFKAVLTAEVTIRKFHGKVSKLKSADVVKLLVDNLMYVWTRTSIPNCHDLCRRILTFFVTSRFKEKGRKEAEDLKEAKARSNTVKQKNSKSTAQWESALQM
ncbi:DNA transposase [Frankliniella fusca]|uniref:DNA transposase n=1 Tax=Frankliniella fusca TaxID=407009 RepID=A0AAE1LIQ9_9NEOP|nr:DNA transposase [Frankliniella fusca]